MHNTLPITERPQADGREQTGSQSPGGVGVAGSPLGLQSFGKAPPGSPRIYRQIRDNPTVAIGRMVVHSAIRTAGYAIATNDDAPAGARELIQQWVVDAKPELMRDATRMLDYGWQSYELVWAEHDGRIVPRKYKPLLPELTTIRIERDTGSFAGLKQRDVEIEPASALLFTHDGEAGNLYGRSLFESIRANAWWPWMQLLEREGQLTTKVASVLMAIGYQPGEGRDANGAKVDNFDLAKRLGENLSRGNVVAWPKVMAQWAHDMLQVNPGIDPDKLMAWTLDYFETRSGHHTEMIGAMRHKEQLMLRGLMVPERAVTEGQHGTKAESETQGDLVLVFAEEVLGEIVRCLNKYVVDRMLAWNFGPDRVGSVKIRAEPLIDEKRLVIQQIIKEVMANPMNTDLLQTIADLPGMAESVGLPVRESAPEFVRSETGGFAEELSNAIFTPPGSSR